MEVKKAFELLQKRLLMPENSEKYHALDTVQDENSEKIRKMLENLTEVFVLWPNDSLDKIKGIQIVNYYDQIRKLNIMFDNDNWANFNDTNCH